MKLLWAVGINRVSTAIVFTLIALIVLSLSALDGCSGWRATAEASRRWLPGAMPDLNRAISLLQTCQPREFPDNRLASVITDGETNGISCINGASDASIDEIIDILKRHRIRSVNYQLDKISKKSLLSASFVLFSDNKEAVSIDYFQEPQWCLKTDDFHNTVLFDTKPLTAPPCHWFWQRDSE